jgi:hypothetical protein
MASSTNNTAMLTSQTELMTLLGRGSCQADEISPLALFELHILCSLLLQVEISLPNRQ